MIHGSTLAKCKQKYRKSRLIDSRDHGWLIMDVNWPPFEICWSIWYTLTKVMSSKLRILHRFSNPFTDTLPKLSFDFGTKLRLTPLLLLLWYHEFHQEKVCPNTIGSVIRLCYEFLVPTDRRKNAETCSNPQSSSSSQVWPQTQFLSF